MRKNECGGLLVAFDGPNGAGKSTLIEQVQQGLINDGLNVYTTKEPTETVLGDFTRQIAESLNGEGLTCLVAADRYNHLKQVIIPELVKGKIVITDRYILSSLILQCMDNVDASFVLAVNNMVILPDIQIAVKANVDVLHSRLYERSKLTHFEREWRSADELTYMEQGVSILIQMGVTILDVENSGCLRENVSHIIKCVKEAI